ncbi:MAG: hypothetical protein ACXVBR_05770 [Flavisolibacter sp.]
MWTNTRLPRRAGSLPLALITVGAGPFGTFTAYVASWFAEKREEEEHEKERKREDRKKLDEEAKNLL